VSEPGASESKRSKHLRAEPVEVNGKKVNKEKGMICVTKVYERATLN
jgi:hypothetical protein